MEIGCRHLGGPVLISGVTVMVAMAGLGVTATRSSSASASAAMLVVAVAVLGSMTFLPAMLLVPTSRRLRRATWAAGARRARAPGQGQVARLGTDPHASPEAPLLLGASSPPPARTHSNCPALGIRMPRPHGFDGCSTAEP